MNREKKNKIFVLFVLSMFILSSIAIAYSSFKPDVGENQESTGYISYQPLSDDDESYLLYNNVVVMKYFYSDDCISCESTERVVNETADYFNGRLFVEKIDTKLYTNETEVFDIAAVPTIYLKGNDISVITEDITTDQLITKVCLLFFDYVEQCSI